MARRMGAFSLGEEAWGGGWEVLDGVQCTTGRGRQCGRAKQRAAVFQAGWGDSVEGCAGKEAGGGRREGGHERRTQQQTTLKLERSGDTTLDTLLPI